MPHGSDVAEPSEPGKGWIELVPWSKVLRKPASALIHADLSTPVPLLFCESVEAQSIEAELGMREEELRQILLVKAIEDTDREGALIPAGDRIAASREAKRSVTRDGAGEDALLTARARVLLRRIVARHNFVETVLALAGGPAWLSWLFIAISLIVGVGLSALDGRRRINILSFPLLALILWNLAVYGFIAIRAVRQSSVITKGRGVSALIAYIGVARASRLVARSRAFDVPLARALSRFTREWYEAARPLLLLRATRLLHVCAAAVGLGLVVGLYLRGIAFEYLSACERTFLDPSEVRAILSVLYKPALMLTGITLPDAAYFETLQFGNAGEGENAGRWIHLLAATAVVFVVAPRLLMTLVASVRIWRMSQRVSLPPALTRYYRNVFGAAGLAERSLTHVVPYAYEPKPNTLARLETLLAAQHGAHQSMEVQPMVPYGDEHAFMAHLQAREDPPPDTLVLLTSLAATPEDENHGVLIAALRDWLAAANLRSQLLVVVDEGPYVRRMSTQGGALTRVDERRSVWSEYISARGVKPCLADLSS